MQPDLIGADIRLHRRILGRPHLERRLRGLLIAIHRFSRGRARTPEDLRWCAIAIDGLQAVLQRLDTERRPPA